METSIQKYRMTTKALADDMQTRALKQHRSQGAMVQHEEQLSELNEERYETMEQVIELKSAVNDQNDKYLLEQKKTEKGRHSKT